MSDTENKCLCEESLHQAEFEAHQCSCSPCAKMFMSIVAKMMNCCGSNGGTPTDPTDPTEPEGGEEYRVDKHMVSDAGIDGLVPFATSCNSGYGAWKAFQVTDPSSTIDAWCAGIGAHPSETSPEWLGLKLDKPHLISKVELIRRGGMTSSDMSFLPRRVKLKGQNDKNEWVDLTDFIEVPDVSTTIVVPQEKQKLVSSVRVEIYATRTTEPYPLIARMRIYGKKVS